jgi:UDP-2,4-diacetamido-2,4,6-trideoxy-beta-L-altropyranose hydrolase
MTSGRSKILVRVDGSSSLGMGHVMRCLRLVSHITNRLDSQPQIEFAVSRDEKARAVISRAGYSILDTVRPFPPEEYDTTAFPEIAAEFAPDLIILDANWSEIPDAVDRLPIDIPVVSLHEHNFPVFKGVSPVFNPSLVDQEIPEGAEEGKTHFQGADYLLLDDELPRLAGLGVAEFTEKPRVLVCMGGSDPDRHTVAIVNALHEDKEIQLAAVIGPAFPTDIQSQLERIYGLQLYISPPRVIPQLVDSDIAIVNAATTMYEAMALGLPTITIARNPYELKQAQKCVNEGAVIMVERDPSFKEIRALIRRIVDEPRLRERLSQRGRRLIDGKGIFRVADILLSQLKS